METRLRVPTSIYECYVEYIRPQNGEEPKLKSTYPKDYEFDEDTKKSLTSFLFPLKDSNTNSEEHFTFTLTNLDGQFRFGFCRYPAKGEVCTCLLSDLPWFKVFYRVMDKIADMQLAYQSELVLPFLKSLRDHPVPNLSTDSVLTFKLDSLEEHVFTFPLPNPRRLPEIPTDHNLTQFYPSLHYEVFLCLFANLMFERRIIITSSSLSMLSSSVHGAVSLLYPLFWQHIFIPITPLHLIDYCTAPMPFLIGVHSSILEQVRHMPINDAVILDVDQNELETPYAEDLIRMPPHIISQLRHKLKKSSSAYGDTVTRALLNCMVAMFGGYRKALKMREGESKVFFDEESFLQSRPHMGNFLSDLFQFQHFQQFVNNRIDRLSKHKERDMFDEEAIVYDEDDKSNKDVSDQIKKGLDVMKHVLKKHGKEALKNTGTLMKDTQKMFQNKSERVGPGDTATLPPAINTQLALGEKSATLDGRGSASPNPTRRPHRPPRPIISYESYKRQKEKLRQSLYLQDKGMMYEEGGLSFMSHGIFNDDALSLDSKESVESGEVLTGNLIDIDDDTLLNRRHSIPVPIIIRPTSDDDETDSASIISSSSGSSSNKLWDVIPSDDVHESTPLPIAPPRSRKKSKPVSDCTAIGNLIDIHSEPPKPTINSAHMLLNRDQGNESPLSDFTSGIAEGLVNLSKRYSDPLVANTVSNTGQDLFNTVDTTQIHIPHPSSTGSLPVLSNSSEERMSTIFEASHPTNDPWKPVDNSPNLSSKGGRSRGPPPKPPLPYIGTGPKLFTGPILTPTASQNDTQESQDPLANIFGNGGLHAYAFQQNNSSTNT